MLYSLRKSLIAAGFLTALAMPPVQAVSPDELFEVLQRIESLENEIRFLRGENEQLRYDIEDVKNTQKSTFIRIDDRMDDLFRSMNSSRSATSVPIVPLASVPVAPVIVEKSVVKSVLPLAKAPVVAPKAVVVPKPVLVKPVPVVAKAAPVVAHVVPVSLSATTAASSVEQIAYNAALSKVQTQPAAAIAQFRGFLKKHPQSPLAANAQYWLGEMMYSRRNYQGAIEEFVTVLQNYGASSKAPDAAMKLGMSFYEMKNWVYARRTLEDVMRNYPQSSAASIAQVRLAKMKADNLY